MEHDETYLRDLIKGIRECFPRPAGSGGWTRNELSAPPGCGRGCIPQVRLWGLGLKPKVPHHFDENGFLVSDVAKVTLNISENGKM